MLVKSLPTFSSSLAQKNASPSVQTGRLHQLITSVLRQTLIASETTEGSPLARWRSISLSLSLSMYIYIYIHMIYIYMICYKHHIIVIKLHYRFVISYRWKHIVMYMYVYVYCIILAKSMYNYCTTQWVHTVHNSKYCNILRYINIHETIMNV